MNRISDNFRPIYCNVQNVRWIEKFELKCEIMKFAVSVMSFVCVWTARHWIAPSGSLFHLSSSLNRRNINVISNCKCEMFSEQTMSVLNIMVALNLFGSSIVFHLEENECEMTWPLTMRTIDILLPSANQWIRPHISFFVKSMSKSLTLSRRLTCSKSFSAAVRLLTREKRRQTLAQASFNCQNTNERWRKRSATQV